MKIAASLAALVFCLSTLAGAAPANVVAQAESLAAAALAGAQADPAKALGEARRALALTADFDPTAFVRAGRKGEVVEDAYQAARDQYRIHRSGLYEAAGEALAQKGDHAAAARYLRRAVSLQGTPGRLARLARSLLALQRTGDALWLLLDAPGLGGPSPETFSLLEQAVDAAGLPSVQAEIDRSRARALSVGSVVYQDGPFTLPTGARLSTGSPFTLGDGVTVVYLAEASCRACSVDLQALSGSVPAGVRAVVIPEDPDRDQALRQVLQLYTHTFPVLLGRGVATAFRMQPGTVLVVGRRGFVGLSLKSPFAPALESAIRLLGRSDVPEALPRAGWSRRPIERRAPVAQPALLPEGLAPGEEEPAPQAFTDALSAYRAGRYAEALRLFEQLEAQGDGWLLSPEARINRGLTLAKLGRREEARRLLLRTGDSRFEEAADRALEAAGSR